MPPLTVHRMNRESLVASGTPNQRFERTGEQARYFMQATVVAGRSTAGRYAH